MITFRVFVIKLVQIHFLTIVISTDSPQDDGSGYLTLRELEYLSNRLYPAECTFLTNALSKSLETNPSKYTAADIAFEQPEIHCFVKLEGWNKLALKDENAHSHVEKILKEMGRFDLAAYLSKNDTRIKSQQKIENKFPE